jgi:hypothetical protein
MSKPKPAIIRPMTDEQRRRLQKMVEEIERNPYPREFKDFDWVKIANYLGAKIEAEDGNQLVFQMMKGAVFMRHHKFGRIEIYDNGGELNLYAERPAMTVAQEQLLGQLEQLNLRANRFFVWHKDVSSVPYTSTRGYVTNIALAYRIRMFLLQKPIDWDWLEEDPETWQFYNTESAWKENGND